VSHSPNNSADDTRLELFRAQVDSTLATVSAYACRKRVMREELLAHLLDAYEDELTCHPAPHAAAEAALCRLGDVHSLAIQLSASVPPAERFISYCLRKEPLMRKVYLRILAAVAVVLIGLAFVFPAVAKWHNEGQFVGQVMLGLCFGSIITLFGLVSLGFGVAQLRARS
jgi:hypothetical protein